MIEKRIKRYLDAQYQAVPQIAVEGLRATGPRQRHPWTRHKAWVAGAAIFVTALVGLTWQALSHPDRAMAASPFSGVQLQVIHDSPVIVRGEIGPMPSLPPTGLDLTFAPIDEPTENDLSAIQELVGTERLSDVTVVALGRIEAFQSSYYAIHGLDPQGGALSLVLEVGPNFPSTIAIGGPSAEETWLPSGGWSPETGVGRETLRVPTNELLYAVLEVDGELFWQRPSDGFFWIPFRAGQDAVRTLTIQDAETGDVVQTFPDMTFR